MLLNRTFRILRLLAKRKVAFLWLPFMKKYSKLKTKDFFVKQDIKYIYDGEKK